MGWPEYMTRVWSSSISLRYFIARRYCAQFWNTAPFPPYVISSSGCWATAGSRLFWIMSMTEAACLHLAGYHSMGYAFMA